VRPMDFIGLPNFHAFAVFPIKRFRELLVVVVVQLTLESFTDSVL
jgi:hypothetical protein